MKKKKEENRGGNVVGFKFMKQGITLIVRIIIIRKRKKGILEKYLHNYFACLYE